MPANSSPASNHVMAGDTGHDPWLLSRRQKARCLPVTPLTLAGTLNPPTDGAWGPPQAIGVGPEQQTLVVWNDPHDRRRGLVTIHGEGRHPERSVMLDEYQPPDFVQPLPGGRILLVRARNDNGPNAEIRGADGSREQAGDLRDAIE
jgi:hypothetical protein